MESEKFPKEAPAAGASRFSAKVPHKSETAGSAGEKLEGEHRESGRPDQSEGGACPGTTSRLSFPQQKQATLFLGSDQRNRMKTMMENRHTAKRSHTHDAIDAWLFFDARRQQQKVDNAKLT